MDSKRGSEKCCRKTFSTTELYVQRVGENLEENLVENPFCYKMYVKQVENNERERRTYYKNHAQRLGIQMSEKNTSLQNAFLFQHDL